MDRVALTLRARGAAEPLPGRVPQTWHLDAESSWLVEGPAELVGEVRQALPDRIADLLAPELLEIRFGNAVGVQPAGPLGTLVVRSGKWTEADYDAMLGDIAEHAAALPFEAGAASALPYARTEVDAPDVLYHAFVWLRHVVVEDPEAPLVGALRAIQRVPHRRMVREDRVVPIERALRLSDRTVDEVLQGRWPLQRVSRGLVLGGGDLLPLEVADSVARSCVDTAENRFVKAFVEGCGHVVDAMRRRAAHLGDALGRRLRLDCERIDGELAPLRRSAWWAEVGRMTFFPASSTVLQRRSSYREILRHHVLMRMASRALPLDAGEIEQLLEVKDVARLYELWCAFAVIGAVAGCLGPPSNARQVQHSDLSATVRYGLQAAWPDGTEVAYNPSYTRGGGFHGRSWSLLLRPDVALWVPRGPAAGLHLLDAKFKLSGPWPSGGEDPDNAPESRATSADVHKMHAYRDAIPQARSAWVMYPGTTVR